VFQSYLGVGLIVGIAKFVPWFEPPFFIFFSFQLMILSILDHGLQLAWFRNGLDSPFPYQGACLRSCN
jgi:hypothetical protein